LITFFCKAKHGLPCKEKSDQPEDGPEKGRSMSLRAAMQEHVSNKNIEHVVFDYI
jgi:hypothetical protein